jgi:hypothetical protein
MGILLKARVLSSSFLFQSFSIVSRENYRKGLLLARIFLFTVFYSFGLFKFKGFGDNRGTEDYFHSLRSHLVIDSSSGTQIKRIVSIKRNERRVSAAANTYTDTSSFASVRRHYIVFPSIRIRIDDYIFSHVESH